MSTSFSRSWFFRENVSSALSSSCFFQVVTWFSPLYQSVVLVRGLTLGVFGWEMLVAVAYLVAMGALGSWITSRRIGLLLRT